MERGDARAPGGAHAGAPLGVAPDLEQRGGEPLPVAGLEEESARPRFDELRDAADARRDDRTAARHRFHQDDGDSFHPAREDEGVAAAVGGGDVGLALRAGEAETGGDSARGDARLEIRPLASFAHELELRVEAGGERVGEGVDEQELSLLRREPSDREETQRRGVRRGGRRLDRRDREPAADDVELRRERGRDRACDLRCA
jgi:hypothetical protein